MAGGTSNRGASRLLEPLVDAALATACYLLAYRVRFFEGDFRDFLPYAIATLPIVVASQLAALALARVYTVPSTRAQLRRLAWALTAGTLVSVALVWRVHGFVGVSRSAFSADLLLILASAAGWRTGRALWRQQRAVTALDGMVDRAAERPTFGETVAAIVRYRQLLKNLVLKDLTLKYRGSVLGFVWSLVHPLVMIAVYTFAFTYIIRTSVPNFVFFLLLGTLAWSFFATSAAMSTGAIIDSGSLMKSVAFPRAILPIATVLFNLAQYLLTITVFLPVMLLYYHVPLSTAMLAYPVFLAMQVLFTFGIALMLSVGTAFFRDIRHLLEVALAILFWLTPILYSISTVDETLRLPLLLSPLSSFVVAYQQIFYSGRWPELTLWIIALAYSVGTFIVGTWLFLSVEDQLVEQI